MNDISAFTSQSYKKFTISANNINIILTQNAFCHNIKVSAFTTCSEDINKKGLLKQSFLTVVNTLSRGD